MQVYIPCRCEHVRIKGDRSAGVKCGSVSLGNFNEMEIRLKKKKKKEEIKKTMRPSFRGTSAYVCECVITFMHI